MLVEKLIKIEDEPVYLVGSVNDKIDSILNEIEKQDLRNCHLFFLGNLNLNDTSELDDKFLLFYHMLSMRNIHSYLLRGSNDGIDIWNDEFEFETRNHSFVRFVNERTRLEINGNKGLIIPAKSNDDLPMMPLDFNDFGENRKNIDFIIGHGGPVLSDFFKNSPILSEKYLKHGLFNDAFKKNQDEYKKILLRYRPKRWYCSHYNIDKQIKFVWDNWSDDGVIYLKIIPECGILRIA